MSLQKYKLSSLKDKIEAKEKTRLELEEATRVAKKGNKKPRLGRKGRGK